MIEVRDLSPAPPQPPQHAYSPVEDYRPQTMESVHSDYRSSARSRDYGNFSRPTQDGRDDSYYYENRYSSSTLALDSPHHHNGNMPSGYTPKFAPRAASYTDSPAGTRSSSPYPGASPYRSTDTLSRPLVPEHNASTFLAKDWVKEGSIAKLHHRDDREFLSGWRRKIYYMIPFLAVLALGLFWLYFGLRVAFILDAQRTFGQTFPLAWTFVTIEIICSIPTFTQTFWALFSVKKRNRPKLRLIGNDTPYVDVFITCCGEDDDLVLDTVRAAADLDWPRDRFRVILLDDGKSASLERAVEDMKDTYYNVFYRSRPKFPGVPHHFKAGNLNYGLDEVHNMPGGAYEFMAALDADMIPEQHWLRAIVPHMVLDSKMALACPPQLFYNVPKDDPLCQTLDFFVHGLEPIKDALGVAWCTGSGYVVRREALDDIGNIPLGSLAEDVATSTLMLGKGWKTAFIHESLQFGTVPDDFGSHLKQRTRWCIGTVDTAIKLKFCLWGDAVRQMTFYQKLSSFIFAFLSLFNVFQVISYFAMPIVLIMNKPLVAFSNEEQLRWLIRACFASIIVARITEMVLYLPAGYSTGQRGARMAIWMAPYLALTTLRTFVLPKWLGGATQAFKPTGSLQSALNERDPKLRAPLWRRLWVTIVNYMAWYHVAMVYLILTAVVLSSYRCFLENESARNKIMCLLTHAFWPPLAWILICSSFWIPITYACDPPDMPDREELLTRDPKTGVAHPTTYNKKMAVAPQTAWFEFENTFMTLYTTGIFVLSFFF